MRHYVYKLIETKTGEFYYGLRSSKWHPEKDIYMGSMVSWNPNKSNLVKEIVSEFTDREDAVEYERRLIKKHISNPLNRNYHTGSGMSFYGKKRTEDEIKRIKKAMTGKNKGKENPFYGRKHSKETLEKMRDVKLGHQHSEETKKKMSDTAKSIDKSGYNFKGFQKRKKVMFLETNEIFISIYQASKSLGISRSYIRKHLGTKFRLLNENENTL